MQETTCRIFERKLSVVKGKKRMWMASLALIFTLAILSLDRMEGPHSSPSPSTFPVSDSELTKRKELAAKNFASLRSAGNNHRMTGLAEFILSGIETEEAKRHARVARSPGI